MIAANPIMSYGTESRKGPLPVGQLVRVENAKACVGGERGHLTAPPSHYPKRKKSQIGGAFGCETSTVLRAERREERDRRANKARDDKRDQIIKKKRRKASCRSRSAREGNPEYFSNTESTDPFDELAPIKPTLLQRDGDRC